MKNFEKKETEGRKERPIDNLHDQFKGRVKQWAVECNDNMAFLDPAKDIKIFDSEKAKKFLRPKFKDIIEQISRISDTGIQTQVFRAFIDEIGFNDRDLGSIDQEKLQEINRMYKEMACRMAYESVRDIYSYNPNWLQC